MSARHFLLASLGRAVTMTRRLGLAAPLAAGVALAPAVAAAQPSSSPPQEDASSVSARVERALVAGPEDDPIAARVQKELTALGFEAIRVGAMEGCARSVLVVTALDQEAAVALCSDGDQVGVWIADRGTLRLRDVVTSDDAAGAARVDVERRRETIAVRAAEVARAAVALPETDPSAPPPRPSAPPPLDPAGWDDFEKPDRPAVNPAPPAPERYAPRFSASVGASALIGRDALVGAVSTQVTVALHRRLSLAARLDYPLSDWNLMAARRDGSGISGVYDFAPGLAGVGVEVPLLRTTRFLVPRVGAGLGVAWMHVSKRAFASTGDASDTAFSPAGYLGAGISIRVHGPLRAVLDGQLGATTSRFVVGSASQPLAYWGQPFVALASRVEVMFP